MPSFKTLFASAVMAYLANAKTIKITATSDNKFDPDSVEADNGDILEFHFEPKNHSVVAGDYQYPCSPMELGTGFFSGFVDSDDGEADKVFQVTVNGTSPTPFYSSQGDECAKGMVGIVNPSSNKTLDDYKKRASELSKGVTPGKAIFGGKLVDSDDADSDSDSDDKGDDNKDNDDSKDSSSKDDEDAAGSLHVPMFGLLGAISVAFFMA
ncbi:Fc.00g088130.m01.CDS01 [Cosmosporella sp. VM-42]